MIIYLLTNTLIILTGIILVFFFIWCLSYLNKTKSIHNLKDCYDIQTINAACKFYVQTNSQNHPPNYEDEPGYSVVNVVKEQTIPFFIKRTFSMMKKRDRFYLVLADSGTGKTTFIINLYLAYTSFLNFKRKYNIKIFTFNGKDILEEIRKIKDAENTILLLDAFDEDMEFHKDYYKDCITSRENFNMRLNEVLESTNKFHNVIITCRTQYFLMQEERPYEIKFQSNEKSRIYTLEKIYISPFDANDINKYLTNKYGGPLVFWNKKKKRLAKLAIKKSPRLMVRPMLLSYIDLLITETSKFENIYDIYEKLVKKWLERESMRIRYKCKKHQKFKEDLDKYSRLVAIKIYEERLKKNTLSLTKYEAIDIAKINKFDLSEYETTGQSLLTCDAEDNWKFAHRSIYDFIIAREIIENIGFLKGFSSENMRIPEVFLREKDWDFAFIKGGTFLMGSPDDEVGRKNDESQHEVRVSSFFISRYHITVKQFAIFKSEENYTKLEYENRLHCHGQNNNEKYPIVHVSWNDAKEYCKWLSKKLNLTVRLPTEAEWEYACRADTITPFYTGKNLTTAQANYDGNYPYNNYPKGKFIDHPKEVGSYEPNAWKLYDMHGNVWEWCEDFYGEDYYDNCKNQGITENPINSENNDSFRILRGGSWNYGARYCRSSFRNRYSQDGCSNFIGFRVVCIP